MTSRGLSFTAAHRSAADRSAARQLPFGRYRPAFFHTEASEPSPPPGLPLPLAQSLSERHRGYPPASGESARVLGESPLGLREWDHAPARKSRPRGLRPHPAPSTSRDRNRRRYIKTDRRKRARSNRQCDLGEHR